MWFVNSVKARAALGVDPSERPWTSRPDVRLRGVHGNQRNLELLDILYMQRAKQLGVSFDNSTAVAAGLWADMSQDIHRQSVHGMRTLTTSSIWYSFEMDRTLQASEYLFLLGYSSVNLANLSFNKVKDLAGEAMSLPSLAMVLYCTLLGCEIDVWKNGGVDVKDF